MLVPSVITPSSAQPARSTIATAAARTVGPVCHGAPAARVIFSDATRRRAPKTRTRRLAERSASTGSYVPLRRLVFELGVDHVRVLGRRRLPALGTGRRRLRAARLLVHRLGELVRRRLELLERAAELLGVAALPVALEHTL